MADQPGNAPPEGLSENHQRRLLATAQYVDRLLRDIESILSGVESPFARYLDDIRPAQKAAVAASVVRLRTDLLHALAAEGIQPGPPRFSARHTIRTNLRFVEIALEELKPRYMRGYGEMPRTAGATLETIVEDLQNIVRKVDAVLAEPS